MSHRTARTPLVLLAVAATLIAGPLTAGTPPPPATVAGAPFVLAKPVPPEKLWHKAQERTVSGDPHPNCVGFSDFERDICKGPITKIRVFHKGFIHGIQIWYGGEAGRSQGYTDDIPSTDWEVPADARIAAVEVATSGRYVTRLRFIADKGGESEVFGAKSGRLTRLGGPGKGSLRTISSMANMERGKSLNRAITRLTFTFGAPCFIKRVEFDLAALDAARSKTKPEQCARQDFTNLSSVEQTATYEYSTALTRSTTFTIERSIELMVGASVYGEISGKMSGVTATVGAEVYSEATAKSTTTRANTLTQEARVTWSIPIKVPPRTRIVATSTWRKHNVKIPFNYTVAWYEGSEDNIKKAITLPGLFEDLRVDDLKHDFVEVPLN